MDIQLRVKSLVDFKPHRILLLKSHGDWLFALTGMNVLNMHAVNERMLISKLASMY